ncbi:AMP-binding protein [Suttonella ornithocola]|uniref:Acetyl-coenzyme A synthetase n=1 Tax=Suttonella ornithocola TaxID=279832 RepID=A0A380MVI5_9GAMM|nr:AMP-binding protein [Suttonella ornithocola]SUO95417.1 Acetyl-coenzyme A synthetase [Suttonella ornithocola]
MKEGWQRFEAAVTREQKLAEEGHLLATTLIKHQAHAIAVSTQNAREMLVAVVAASYANCMLILPPNLAAQTVKWCDAHCDYWFGQNIPAQKEKPSLQATDTEAVECSLQDIPIALMTSGSTGQPKILQFSLNVLCQEVCGFACALDGRSQVLSTVSLQHRYGLTSHVLYPFLFDVPYTPQSAEMPDVLLAPTGQVPVWWISSPTFLQHLVQHPDLPAWKGKVAGIFSAGGKLSDKLRTRLETILELEVSDIYGSSETGIIACRKGQPDFCWLPAIQATVEEEQCQISAVWLENPVTLGDRIRSNQDGSFQVLGRLDSIIKIADKRVDLSYLTQVLMADARVADVHLCLHSKGSHLFAWVALSPKGIDVLREQGRKTLVKQLQAIIAEDQARIAIPRYWHFTDQLPRNGMSKLAKSAIEHAMHTAPEAPEWEVLNETKETAIFQGRVPLDLRYLRGHFDEIGIVAGVIEVKWVCALAQRWLNQTVSAQIIENLKFQKLLRPYDLLTVELSLNKEGNKLIFVCKNALGVCASGRIVLCE